jgi:hypothetical protein
MREATKNQREKWHAIPNRVLLTFICETSMNKMHCVGGPDDDPTKREDLDQPDATDETDGDDDDPEDDDDDDDEEDDDAVDGEGSDD